MRHIKKILFSISVIFLFLISTNVDAAKNYEYGTYLCIDDMTYEVSSKGEKVTFSDLYSLTTENISKQCAKFKTLKDPLTGKITTLNSCETGYKISATKTGSGCVRQNPDSTSGTYGILGCPTDSDLKNFTIGANRSDSTYYETVQIVGSNKYRVIFPNLDTSKVYIRKYQAVELTINGSTVSSFTPTESAQSGDYTDFPQGVNSFLVDPGESFYVEFRLDKNSKSACAGVFIGYVQGAAPLAIANPVLNLTSGGVNICDNLKRETGSSSLVQALVPECFQTEVNYGSSVSRTTAAQLLEKIANAKSIINLETTTTTAIGEQKCSFLKDGETNETANKYTNTTTTQILPATKDNTYWIATCTETVDVVYDDPKAVNAGGGFQYQTKVTTTRTCTPQQIKVPVRQDECKYSAECYGKGHSGEPAAGPNDDFDSCVESCDGGNYSQSCINSCYDKVYGSSKTASTEESTSLQTLPLKYLSFDSEITRIATGDENKNTINNCTIGSTTFTTRPLSSCKVIGGNQGCVSELNGETYDCPQCKTDHNFYINYCDSCNGEGTQGEYSSNGVQCYEVFLSSATCVENADNAYYKDVEKSKDELENVVNLINTYSKSDYEDESVKIQILDNYSRKLVDVTPKKELLSSESTKISSNNNYVISESDVSGTDENGKPYKIELGDRTVEVPTWQVKRVETINLEQAYLNKYSTEVTYLEDTKDCSKTNNEKYCLNYYDGGYKYYTNLYTPTINYYLDWPTYNDKNTDYSILTFTNRVNGKEENIHVSLENYGTWNQWNVNVDCIYGVANNFIKKPDPSPSPTATPTSSNPTIIKPGVQYMFRQVDLSNLFPNRDPRWNWSSKATNINSLLYTINPTALIQNIQKKGDANTFIDTELDYEITITKDDIKKIRSYNKSKKSYLDNDMDCYYSGNKVICESNFLESDNLSAFVRSKEAGTNNRSGVNE